MVKNYFVHKTKLSAQLSMFDGSSLMQCIAYFPVMMMRMMM